jgi:hypothetical protein
MENYTPYSSRLGAAWWLQHCHLALGKSERITSLQYIGDFDYTIA